MCEALSGNRERIMAAQGYTAFVSSAASKRCATLRTRKTRERRRVCHALLFWRRKPAEVPKTRLEWVMDKGKTLLSSDAVFAACIVAAVLGTIMAVVAIRRFAAKFRDRAEARRKYEYAMWTNEELEETIARLDEELQKGRGKRYILQTRMRATSGKLEREKRHIAQLEREKEELVERLGKMKHKKATLDLLLKKGRDQLDEVEDEIELERMTLQSQVNTSAMEVLTTQQSLERVEQEQAAALDYFREQQARKAEIDFQLARYVATAVYDALIFDKLDLKRTRCREPAPEELEWEDTTTDETLSSETAVSETA